jgi:hypothetical protein
VDHGVHIISMSWSLVKTRDNAKEIESLAKNIQDAANAGTIMYCAAADRGSYFPDNSDLYPHQTDTAHIKVVGSAKEGGGESHFVDSSQVHYLFPGEKIQGLGGQEGSSAATAVAAGFAALVLWCFRKKPPPTHDPDMMANPAKMHHVFESLKADKKKWVNVTRMLKPDGSATIDDVVTHCVSATNLNWKLK